MGDDGMSEDGVTENGVTADGVAEDDVTEGGVSDDDVNDDRLDRQLLRKLLGMWAGFALLPGIVTINQPVVLAYVVWGIGFFAALALFITIARITQTTDLWPWLVASILPWVVNLAVPATPMYIPVLVLAAGAFAARIYLRSSATDRLLHEGVDGTGVVIEVIEPKAVNAVVNNGYVRRSVRVTVERADKIKTYEAVVRDLFKVEELPTPGDRLPLRIDPEDAKRVVMVPQEKPAAEAPSTPIDDSVDEPDEGETTEAS